MKKLKLEFKKGTSLYKQVWRDDDYAIYEQANIAGGKVNYEVIKITKGKATVIKGVPVAASERFPSPEQWGQYAYTVDSIERAHEKIEQEFKQRSGKPGRRTKSN